MSEHEALFSTSDQKVPAQTSDSSPGAGLLLKEARESVGLHIAALAVLLKVPVKKLEALEGGRFDLLPDAVFVRALASSVCRTLKIDPAPVLARLPHTDTPKLTYQGVGINTPFRAPGDGPGPSAWSQLSRPAVIAGLFLLLGAMVLIFLPAIKSGVQETKTGSMDARSTAGATRDSEKSVPNGLKPSNQINVEASGAAEGYGSSSSALLATQSRDSTSTAQAMAAVVLPLRAETSVTFATANTSSSLAKPTVTATPSVPAPQTGTQAQAATTTSPTFVVSAPSILATDVVVFTAKSESWVEVVDSKGQVVLRRVLGIGEVAGAAGSLPLKVVVGRANATQVVVRGQTVDLSAIAKDNIARFEVK